MADLPKGLTESRRTPVFTPATMPAGLKKSHVAPLWAVLHVERGSVVFVDETDGSKNIVHSDETHVIVPGHFHHVSPSEDAEFYIVFYGDQPDQISEVKLTKK
jgi:tellurite resistance-related uncharacterized protein